jgi:hypothetical protein
VKVASQDAQSRCHKERKGRDKGPIIPPAAGNWTSGSTGLGCSPCCLRMWQGFHVPWRLDGRTEGPWGLPAADKASGQSRPWPASVPCPSAGVTLQQQFTAQGWHTCFLLRTPGLPFLRRMSSRCPGTGFSSFGVGTAI